VRVVVNLFGLPLLTSAPFLFLVSLARLNSLGDASVVQLYMFQDIADLGFGCVCLLDAGRRFGVVSSRSSSTAIAVKVPPQSEARSHKVAGDSCLMCERNEMSPCS
jgi:hypothetical protein